MHLRDILEAEQHELIGRIAHQSATKQDFARYNANVITSIQQSHFTREMALEARREKSSRRLTL